MADYLPFASGPYRMQMGLRPLDLAEWIEIDADLGAILREKRRLLSLRHSEVFAALPATAAAGEEVLDLLFEHLPRRFPTQYPRMGATIALAATGELIGRRHPSLHPLDAAGRLVPEDFCLMRLSGDSYVLAAASVCFPSRWRLSDKIGRGVAEIHAPVPGYAAAIGGAVDQFFARVAVERPVWRLNWTIHDAHALFQPVPALARAVPRERFADGLFLRVERQTLRRLPQSGDVLFTIRTYVRRLGALAPEAAERLGQALAALPPEMRAYRGLTRFADDLAQWLLARAGDPAAG